MLVVKNLALRFDREVLRAISCTFNPHEIYGIIGPSGAGKSSFLKIISGHLDQTSGEVSLLNKVLPRASQRLIPGHPEIALVAQDYQLDEYHTCAENIREVLLHLPIQKREVLLKKLLKQLGLLHAKELKAYQLSGGEKQRLAIARAIANQPKWLLLDEPFSHLDTPMKLKLQESLRLLCKSEKIGLILVSHDVHDILAICTQISLLRKGKLTKNQAPLERYLNLKSLIDAQWFGEVNCIEWKGETIRFRPNFYDFSEEGLCLECQNIVFNGQTYIHYFYTEKKEIVVLYATIPLEKRITIIPRNVQKIQ